MVYYNGATVSDLTRHQAFSRNVKNVAGYYDLQLRPEFENILRATNEDVGQETGISFVRTRNKDDLKRLREALTVIHDRSYGYFGRSPDYADIWLTALAEDLQQ